MLPTPSTTSPSTGAISWGRMTRTSPTRTSSTGISTCLPSPSRTCAMRGLRSARARSTWVARMDAASSKAAPLVSMRAMIAATNHSPSSPAVPIAMRASRSAPNLRRHASPTTWMARGTPTATTAAYRGIAAIHSGTGSSSAIKDRRMATATASATRPLPVRRKAFAYALTGAPTHARWLLSAGIVDRPSPRSCDRSPAGGLDQPRSGRSVPEAAMLHTRAWACLTMGRVRSRTTAA